eukprot:CAMPEP_0171154686 /NCGR_PEP_ID=MMETSP0790-20130122/468_1 /TAXON_ID=2925 /ORGANISM="Alexandrium catenella, Strain OF101" /LENGTH=77 /DNA_ID=CAMNT_0011618793 /DNA_START=1 /DNA_END=231 /DNA_ORIENTATION=+
MTAGLPQSRVLAFSAFCCCANCSQARFVSAMPPAAVSFATGSYWLCLQRDVHGKDAERLSVTDLVVRTWLGPLNACK